MSIHENIVESIADGIICIEPGLSIIAFNQAIEKITELSRSQVVGKNIKEVFKRDGWFIDIIAATLKQDKIYTAYEGKLCRRISGTIHVGVSTMRIFDDSGNAMGALILVKDLSGIKSFEMESLRKERLLYLGQFAANLAHEVRNPLSGIRGAAQLLSRKVKGKALLEYTGIIIKEVDRLNSTVREMLDFTRASRIKKRNLNIHKILDNVLLLLKEDMPPVIKEYDPSLPPVKGDEGQLTQVFMNLIKNAKEAVGKKKGEITVTTRMVTEFHLIEKGRKEAKFVLIEIKDSGCGIPEENIEKIFTPFFTTKKTGSGLGMGISFRIVKEHGGFLKITSFPDKETRVNVYLPIGGVS